MVRSAGVVFSLLLLEINIDAGLAMAVVELGVLFWLFSFSLVLFSTRMGSLLTVGSPVDSCWLSCCCCSCCC